MWVTLSWHQTKTKKTVSSIWRRGTKLLLLPTSSGLVDETLRQRKCEVSLWNPSEDCVGSTASYISYNISHLRRLCGVISGRSLPLHSPDSVWIATKWNLRGRYVARSSPDLTNHVPSTNRRTNHGGESQTHSRLLPDWWRQSLTLLSPFLCLCSGFSWKKWESNRNQPLSNTFSTCSVKADLHGN